MILEEKMLLNFRGLSLTSDQIQKEYFPTRYSFSVHTTFLHWTFWSSRGKYLNIKNYIRCTVV